MSGVLAIVFAALSVRIFRSAWRRLSKNGLSAAAT